MTPGLQWLHHHHHHCNPGVIIIIIIIIIDVMTPGLQPNDTGLQPL